MLQSKIQSAPTPLVAGADTDRTSKTGILAVAGVAGILASLCCVGPLVLVTLGLGGALAGSLVAFEPYRPIFIGVALLALGWGGWMIYRKPAAACEPGQVCALPETNRTYKIFFWVIVAAVLLSLTFPFFAPLFY